MSDFGLGDDIVNEKKREAALRHHFGTYYYQPEKPQPVELLANPPCATGTDYDAACGSGAFLVDAAKTLDADAETTRDCVTP